MNIPNDCQNGALINPFGFEIFPTFENSCAEEAIRFEGSKKPVRTVNPKAEEIYRRKRCLEFLVKKLRGFSKNQFTALIYNGRPVKRNKGIATHKRFFKLAAPLYIKRM